MSTKSNKAHKHCAVIINTCYSHSPMGVTICDFNKWEELSKWGLSSLDIENSRHAHIGFSVQLEDADGEDILVLMK